jgi:Phage minor capsid protein 2
VTAALPQTGDEREDRAETIGAAIGEAFASAELTIIATIARTARVAAVAGTAGTGAQKVNRTAAAALGLAQAQAAKAVEDAGITPVPKPVTNLIEAAARTAYATARSVYTDAVKAALAADRGGLPYSTLSLSRVQAAQRVISNLAAKGITGFTDSAGRNWDVASYAEMATRTAVSSAYDDLLTGAIRRSGENLVLVGTHSSEGTCPKCLPYLGHLLSITGHVPGYTSLAQAKAAGFRHPSCRCTLSPEHDRADALEAAAAAKSPQQAAKDYAASQQQRALERDVRAAARQAQAAFTPAQRTAARRDLAAARQASQAFRSRSGLHLPMVRIRERESLGAR